MIQDSKKITDTILINELKGILGKGKVGLEKENLRVLNSKISQSKHPEKLGSALCNSFITTDFSESQLELITPPLKDKKSTRDFLDDIHHFVTLSLNEEILWPFSMPPNFQSNLDIPIAYYGNSDIGLFKRVYRNGLSKRYGRAMQSISGIHYNYSLPDDIWELPFMNDNESSLIDIKSKTYLRILRNIYRMNWLIIYLTGASPVLTKGFIDSNKDKDDLKKLNNSNFYLPYATSFRMSDYGYSNTNRIKLNVSPNSLDTYISDLRKATETVSDDFLKIKDKSDEMQSQISPNILQIEDEYYSVARPKSESVGSRRLTSKLIEGGIDFIELRSLDLNPYSRVGIDHETILFLEIFFIFCLTEESKPIDQKEIEDFNKNNLLVAKYGRDPNLSLQKNNKQINLKDWGNEILDKMTPIAEYLDEGSHEYRDIIQSIKLKIKDSNHTLSGRLLNELISGRYNFPDLGNMIGEQNKEFYFNKKKSQNINWNTINKEVLDSVNMQNQLMRSTKKTFNSFIDDYFHY